MADLVAYRERKEVGGSKTGNICKAAYGGSCGLSLPSVLKLLPYSARLHISKYCYSASANRNGRALDLSRGSLFASMLSKTCSFIHWDNSMSEPSSIERYSKDRVIQYKWANVAHTLIAICPPAGPDSMVALLLYTSSLWVYVHCNQSSSLFAQRSKHSDEPYKRPAMTEHDWTRS